MDELKQRILATKSDFEELRIDGGGEINVHYYPGDRVFSFYRFDDKAVITLYRHAKGRSEFVPTILCEKAGSYFAFLEAELESIRANSTPS